jgi:regulator of replication initiation timing
MKHQLETENEELRKRLESTYAELDDVDKKISGYAIMEMAEKIVEMQTQVSKSTILMNNQTFKDIIKWGNT